MILGQYIHILLKEPVHLLSQVKKHQNADGHGHHVAVSTGCQQRQPEHMAGIKRIKHQNGVKHTSQNVHRKTIKQADPQISQIQNQDSCQKG